MFLFGIFGTGLKVMSAESPSSKQLQNLHILVACSAKKMSKLAAQLEIMGANVLSFPVIDIKELEDKHLMDESIASLHKYDWIIFTSAHGVDFFMKRLSESGHGNRELPKICAVGPATAASVKQFGCKTSLLPSQYVAEGVFQALADYYGGNHHLTGLNILLPRAETAREYLPEALAEAGVRVDTVPCYQTVRAKMDPEAMKKLHENRPDLLVFTSSSTINNLMHILGEDAGRKMLMESTVAVIGPVTASTSEAFGKPADIIPTENTIASLLEAIQKYYSRQSPVAGRQL
jgi:uroporphyrinogen III methyltransferase/synthase